MALRKDSMTHWASSMVILMEYPKGLQKDSQTYWALLMALRKDSMTHWARPKVLQRDSLIMKAVLMVHLMV
jgi:hypothetical protein